MKLITLVENTSRCELKAKHGLSLYLETEKHRLLFDLGPDGTLFENAKKRGVDLTGVDVVVISHGHSDHGGALGAFLARHHTAQDYVQCTAFAPHFSKAGLLKLPIGLDPALARHPQVHLLDGDSVIDEELSVFTVADTSRCHSPMNDVLLDENGRDAFAHEQNLVIRGKSTVLLTGCGHCGIVGCCYYHFSTAVVSELVECLFQNLLDHPSGGAVYRCISGWLIETFLGHPSDTFAAVDGYA